MERKGKCFRSPLFFIFLVFLLWVVLLFAAPFVVPNNTLTDCSGVVFLIDNENDFSHLGFPWGQVYMIGDVMCHQRIERSFMFNENSMPFCSRCTAIWLGVVIGIGFTVFYRVTLDEKFLLFLLLCLSPIAVDGFGQVIGLWESSNLVRVITGLLAGGITGVSIGVIFDELVCFRKQNRTILDTGK